MKPVLQALLLADQIYEDGRTGKKVIAGVFDTISIGAFPVSQVEAGEEGGQIARVPGGMTIGSPYAYISLTDVYDTVDLELRYSDIQENRVLMRYTAQVQAASPLETRELVIPMPKLPTPHVGIYALELIYDNELLGAVRVTVKELDAPSSRREDSYERD